MYANYSMSQIATKRHEHSITAHSHISLYWHRPINASIHTRTMHPTRIVYSHTKTKHSRFRAPTLPFPNVRIRIKSFRTKDSLDTVIPREKTATIQYNNITHRAKTCKSRYGPHRAHTAAISSRNTSESCGPPFTPFILN